jgi:hypothetical protein
MDAVSGWGKSYGGGWVAALCGAWLCLVLGCALPPAETLPLEAAAARQALDRWNPQYCKVVEFYGLHTPAAPHTRIAYVLLAAPGEPTAKPTVYEATFQLLTRPEGKQQWFLVSLLNHAGGLTRRQGWDNLMVPVE